MTASRGTRRGDRGVSLVELMIALGVIAVALLALVTMILITQEARQIQREQTIAKEAAVTQLEAIKAVATPSSGTYAAALTAAFPGGTTGAGVYTYTFSISTLNKASTSDKRGLGTITFDTANVDLVYVTVTIEWDSVGQKKSRYELSSLFTKGYN